MYIGRKDCFFTRRQVVVWGSVALAVALVLLALSFTVFLGGFNSGAQPDPTAGVMQLKLERVYPTAGQLGDYRYAWEISEVLDGTTKLRWRDIYNGHEYNHDCLELSDSVDLVVTKYGIIYNGPVETAKDFNRLKLTVTYHHRTITLRV